MRCSGGTSVLKYKTCDVQFRHRHVSVGVDTDSLTTEVESGLGGTGPQREGQEGLRDQTVTGRGTRGRGDDCFLERTDDSEPLMT